MPSSRSCRVSWRQRRRMRASACAPSSAEPMASSAASTCRISWPTKRSQLSPRRASWLPPTLDGPTTSGFWPSKLRSSRRPWSGSKTPSPHYRTTSVHVCGLAERCSSSERTEAARAQFERALTIDPESAAAKVGLARIDLQSAPARAARALEEAIEQQPQAKRLHYFAAQAYRRLGDEEAARSHATRYGPGDVAFPEPLLQSLVEAGPGRRLFRCNGRPGRGRGPPRVRGELLSSCAGARARRSPRARRTRQRPRAAGPSRGCSSLLRASSGRRSGARTPTRSSRSGPGRARPLDRSPCGARDCAPSRSPGSACDPPACGSGGSPGEVRPSLCSSTSRSSSGTRKTPAHCSAVHRHSWRSARVRRHSPRSDACSRPGPSDIGVRINLATLLARGGDPQAATAELEALLEEEGVSRESSALAHYNLGIFALRAGLLDDARSRLEQGGENRRRAGRGPFPTRRPDRTERRSQGHSASHPGRRARWRARARAGWR